MDNLSSAHVYLRLTNDQDWTAIDEHLLNDCAQLVKANSIEGHKKESVTVIYTPWSNLKKTQGMEVGQVGFKSNSTVKKLKVLLSNAKPIVNRLNKTKVEKFPDLDREKVEHEREKKKAQRAEEKRRRDAAIEEKKKWQAEKEERSYDSVLKESQMRSNSDVSLAYVDPSTGSVDVNAFEEDFM